MRNFPRLPILTAGHETMLVDAIRETRVLRLRESHMTVITVSFACADSSLFPRPPEKKKSLRTMLVQSLPKLYGDLTFSARSHILI